MTGTLVDALLAVHRILNAAAVPHALCGGLAANLYRDEVRATMDVDLIVAVGPARVVGLVRTLSEEGWQVEPCWQQGEQLRLSHKKLPRVDCLVATTDYQRAAIERSVPAQIKEQEISVLTPEDLIVFKLSAGRARDYEAVAAIVNTHRAKLDVDYIKGWLEQFGIPEAWERAIDEAGREAEA